MESIVELKAKAWDLEQQCRDAGLEEMKIKDRVEVLLEELRDFLNDEGCRLYSKEASQDVQGKLAYLNHAVSLLVERQTISETLKRDKDEVVEKMGAE